MNVLFLLRIYGQKIRCFVLSLFVFNQLKCQNNGGKMSRILILVPARYGSSRFPGKPLAKILGKSMIGHMIEHCQQTGFDYAVVTDNDEIEAEVKSLSGNVVRVDDDVISGSERIALALDRYFSDKNYDYVINVQGDEPLISAEEIKSIGVFHEKYSQFDICTAVKKRESSDEDYKNPNVVKAIYSQASHQCLYFTRASAPYDRDNEGVNWYQHIGIYSYKVDALKRFVTLSPSTLELNEKLEQLRALENGMLIGAKTTDINLIGVDTPDDLAKIEGVLRGKEV